MTRRRVVIATILAVACVVGGVGGWYVHDQLATHNIRGSSTVEFVPTDAPPGDATQTAPAATTTATTPTDTSPPEPAEPWPQYGFDQQRTQAPPPSYGITPPFRVAWQRQLGLLEFPPVIAYGRLFVTNGAGTLYAVDAATGVVAWRDELHRCAASSPVASGRVIYQGFMAGSCARRGGETGFVAAFDAQTGRTLWRVTTGVVESSPLLVGTSLIFGTWGGSVVALDTTTRHVRWRFAVPSDVVAGVAFAHGTIYAASNGGTLYALDAATGAERWSSSSFAVFGAREYFYATPAVAYGRVYAPNTDGYVYSFGEQHGALRWARRAGTYVYTAPAVWHDTVYVATYDGYAVALDAATGLERWRVALPSAAHGALSVIRGIVYVSCFGVNAPGAARYVKNGPAATVGIDATTGRVVWHSPTGRYTPMTADTHRVYFNTGSGLEALVPARLTAYSGRVQKPQALIVIGAALGLVLASVPFLEADPAGLVGAASVDPGVVRVAAAACAVVIALAGLVVVWSGRGLVPVSVASVVLAVVALVAAPTIHAIRYRDTHAPYVYVNDSAYQVEIAGDLLRRGVDPYGHSYAGSGLERLYVGSAESQTRSPAALTHFAYFPLLPVAAAAWRLLPAPARDIRAFVALVTLALVGAAFLFPAPLHARLVAGLALAANPLLVRGAWFGTLDAAAILPLVASFALLNRRRFVLAGVALAAACLTKQFVVIGVVFGAVEALRVGGSRNAARFVAATLAPILLVCVPFLVWDPHAFLTDTITYGAQTYRIVGYGLSNLLVHAHVVNRYGSYPFWPILAVTWLPVTIAALAAQRRVNAAWAAPAAFAVSMLVLVYVARVFQTSYLAYPLAAIIAAALASGERPVVAPPRPG